MATKSTDPIKSFEAAVAQGKEQLDAALKAGTDAATKNYEQVLAITTESLDKIQVAAQKNLDELVALNKDNYEAFVKSGDIVAKGAEQFGKELATYTEATVTEGQAYLKQVTGVKTVNELVDLQSAVAKTSFDKAVAEANKLSEMGVKMAQDAFAPIQARFEAAAQTFAKPLA